MKTVSIFGYLPPPTGGVAIHIERLSMRLNKTGILENVYNFGASGYSGKEISGKVKSIRISTRFDILGYLYWLLRFGFTDKSGLIHFHNNENGSFAILLAKNIFHKKIVITMHDQMRLIRKVKWYRAWYVTPFLNLLYKQPDISWIATNGNIKDQLISKGINANMISIIPAFIKPPEGGQDALDEDVINFISSRSPLLSIYAMTTRIEDGIDLYGVDISLRLIAALKAEYPDIGLVVCIPGDKNDKIMKNYSRFIEEESLSGNILFIRENINNASELWKQSDIFLRPTNNDGDSLCVREALDVNTVVLASDVVQRPEGTVLFKNRDVNDFTLKAQYILENDTIVKDKHVNISDNFEPLLNVYYSILKERE